MKKYNVYVEAVINTEYEVEAEDAETAESIAEELLILQTPAAFLENLYSEAEELG